MSSRSGRTSNGNSAGRIRRYGVRALGLKPSQVWVYDEKVPGFAEEARRQSLATSRVSGERDILGFMECTFDQSEWS